MTVDKFVVTVWYALFCLSVMNSGRFLYCGAMETINYSIHCLKSVWIINQNLIIQTKFRTSNITNLCPIISGSSGYIVNKKFYAFLSEKLASLVCLWIGWNWYCCTFATCIGPVVMMHTTSTCIALLHCLYRASASFAVCTL